MIQRIQNTPRGPQGKQPLCTDLQWTTLDVVNYKTYSDARNQFSTLWDLVKVTSEIYKDKDNKYE